MEHQICSIEELAEQYCRKLPRPKVEIEILVDDIVIGFKSIKIVGCGIDEKCEPVYYMSYMKYDGDNKEECKNKLLNNFIEKVAYQAEELYKRELVMNVIADLSKRL